MNIQKMTIRMCKSLIVSYLVTLALMLLIALAIWKIDLGGNVLRGIVIGLYVISSVAGGFYIGKKQKEKKFLWGLLTGCLYFFILFILTVTAGDFTGRLGIHFVTTFLICAMSGTLGGMLA